MSAEKQLKAATVLEPRNAPRTTNQHLAKPANPIPFPPKEERAMSRLAILILLTTGPGVAQTTQTNDASTLAQHGIEAARKGDYESAEKQLKAAIVLDPHNAPLVYNLGLVEERRGDLASALSCFETYAQMDPAAPNIAGVNVKITSLRSRIGADSSHNWSKARPAQVAPNSGGTDKHVSQHPEIGTRPPEDDVTQHDDMITITESVPGQATIVDPPKKRRDHTSRPREDAQDALSVASVFSTDNENYFHVTVGGQHCELTRTAKCRLLLPKRDSVNVTVSGDADFEQQLNLSSIPTEYEVVHRPATASILIFLGSLALVSGGAYGLATCGSQTCGPTSAGVLTVGSIGLLTVALVELMSPPHNYIKVAEPPRTAP